MKQVVQNYRSGELHVARVPEAMCRSGEVLVHLGASLVSVGTERYMLDLAQKSLLGKALARPDLVRRVIDKAREEGPLEAWRQAKGRLDAPVPLGYSAVGVVMELRNGLSSFLRRGLARQCRWWRWLRLAL